MDDATFFCSGSGAVSVVTATGVPPGWIVLGPVSADASGSGSGNCGQFSWTLKAGLNNVPGGSEFVTLFERYQIVGMECKIVPIMGDSYNSAVGCPLPTIYAVEDYTDDAIIPSFSACQQYGQVKEYALSQNKAFVHSITPKASTLMYVGGALVGYQSSAHRSDMWLDTVGTGNAVPHYGLKFYVRNFLISAVGSGLGFRVTPTLYLKMRETR